MVVGQTGNLIVARHVGPSDTSVRAVASWISALAEVGFSRCCRGREADGQSRFVLREGNGCWDGQASFFVTNYFIAATSYIQG